MVHLSLYKYAIIGAVILSLVGYGWFEHNRFVKKSLEFDLFVSDTKTLAAIALSDKVRKEKENEDRINNALRSRDVALNKLREFQSASRGQLPGSPQTAGSSETICWSTDRFDSRLQELEGILIEGQKAVEENKLWLESWPQ